jgi:hypothetical protein
MSYSFPLYASQLSAFMSYGKIVYGSAAQPRVLHPNSGALQGAAATPNILCCVCPDVLPVSISSTGSSGAIDFRKDISKGNCRLHLCLKFVRIAMGPLSGKFGYFALHAA